LNGADRLAGMAVILGVGLAIGTAIGAVILRAAVSLYNRFVGGANSPSSVKEPSFGSAFLISFVTNLVNWIVGFGIGVVIGVLGIATRSRPLNTMLLAQFISMPVSVIVMSCMLSMLLPAKFGRAFGVSCCYLLVCVVILVVVFLITMMSSGLFFR